MADRPSIIVIGAGASGLACARTLKEVYGARVTVVEASERVGGRVRQDKDFAAGLELEIGAEFVHGSTTILNDMAERHGWLLRPLFTWSQGDGGPSDTEAPDGGAGYYWVGATRKLHRFDRLPRELDALHDALWELGDSDIDEARQETRTMAEYLRGKGVPESAIAMADAGYANTQSCAIDDLGAGRAIEFERMWTEVDGEGDFRLDPSFRLVIERLSREVDVRLRSPVSVVHVDESGVSLRIAGGRRMRADAAVVTVSLGVLRDEVIRFCPPLPEAKRKAIKRIQFENAVKIHLKFRRRFWPADCHGGVCSDAFIPEFWINCSGGIGARVDASGEEVPPPSTAARVTGGAAGAGGARPVEWVVTGFATAAYAAKVLEIGKHAAIARFLSQLDEIFGLRGAATSAFVAGQVHSWGDNPWVRGGYTCPHVDEPIWARRELGRPVGDKLYFAGEACAGAVAERPTDADELSPLCLHSAISSGVATAHKLAKKRGLRALNPASRL